MSPVRMLLLAAATTLLMGQAPPPTAPPGAIITGKVFVVDGRTPVPSDDVWVYLRVPNARPSTRKEWPGLKDPRSPYVITQEGKRFSRSSLVVPLGATVAFPNKDLVIHNVFSPNPFFDLGEYSFDRVGKSHQFTAVAEADIYCDVHKDMSSKVKTVDTRPEFIAHVAADGSYRFEGVPAGGYEVVAWVPDARAEDFSTVEVSGTGAFTPLEIHLQKVQRAATHLNKTGKDYPYDR